MNITLRRDPAATPAPARSRRSRRARARRERKTRVEFRTIVSSHQRNTKWGKRIYWTVFATVFTLFSLVFVLLSSLLRAWMGQALRTR